MPSVVNKLCFFVLTSLRVSVLRRSSPKHHVVGDTDPSKFLNIKEMGGAVPGCGCALVLLLSLSSACSESPQNSNFVPGTDLSL